MACEEEKLQVELLEILLQSQDNAIGDVIDDYHDALEKVEKECIAIHFTDDFRIREECEEALSKANQLYDEIWYEEHLWLLIKSTLQEARDRYSNCLHKLEAGIPDD